MKFIVKPFELEQPLDPNGMLANIKLEGPAKFLKAILGAKPAPPLLIATPSQNPQQQIMLVPVLFFECWPEMTLGEQVKTFLIIPPSKLIEDTSRNFEYRDSLLYPDGKLFFVYEQI